MYLDLTHRIFYDAEDTAGAAADVKDRDVDQMTEDEIDEMGQDDLDRVEIDEESGRATLKDPEKKEEETPETDEDQDKEADEKKTEGDDKDKKPDDGKTEEKEDEGSKLDKQISDLENIPKEERTSEQVLELRRLNAERRMHQATREASELRKTNEELQKKLYEKEMAEEDEFEQLSEEEEKDLKETDPEEFAKYEQEKDKYIERETNRAKSQAQNTFINIAAFYKGLKGAEDSIDELLEVEKLQDGTQRFKNAAFQEFLKSDEFKRVDKFVTDNMKKRYDGTYTSQQMMDAHYIVNKDKILSDTKLAGREQALNDIKRASSSDASKLENVPKSEGKKGLKRVSDLTDDEIESMSEDEMKSYQAQMEREGLA